MTMQHQDNLVAALALASAGIKIFPAGADKRPLAEGMAGRSDMQCRSDQYVVGACSRNTGNPLWAEQPHGDRL